MDVVTKAIQGIDEFEALNVQHTFITAILGTFLCCCLIIAAVFACLRGKIYRTNICHSERASRNVTELDVSSTLPRDQSEDKGNIDASNYSENNSDRLKRCDSSFSDSSVFTEKSLPLQDPGGFCETDYIYSIQRWSSGCARTITNYSAAVISTKKNILPVNKRDKIGIF